MSNAFIVRLTITLDDVTPAVSREIEVPLGIRLDRLHSVFQAHWRGRTVICGS